MRGSFMYATPTHANPLKIMKSALEYGLSCENKLCDMVIAHIY